MEANIVWSRLGDKLKDLKLLRVISFGGLMSKVQRWVSK